LQIRGVYQNQGRNRGFVRLGHPGIVPETGRYCLRLLSSQLPW
jgi:hypothetical protein